MSGNLLLQSHSLRLRLIDRMSLSLGIGILINLSLIYAGVSLRVAMGILLLLGLIGFGFFCFNIRKEKIQFKSGVFFFCLYVGFVLFFKETAEGFLDWDARSIWLFNSKIILNEGGIPFDAVLTHASFYWNHPDHPEFTTINWAHPGYPKLIPAMAAQASAYFGYWNEYLPKISIFLVLFYSLLMVMRFAEFTFSFVLFFLAMFCSQFAVLWNGYMDGLSALFTGLLMWLLLEFYSKGKNIDLISAFITTGILLNIKNEGGLQAICVWLPFLFLARKQIFKVEKRIWLNGGLVFIPTVLWVLRKKQLGIESEFNFISVETFSRTWDRLNDGISLNKILKAMLITHSHTWKALVLIGVIVLGLYFLSKARKTQKSFMNHLSLIAMPTFSAVLYSLGLFLVYISTPFFLDYHLYASVDRTMIVFYLLILVSVSRALVWIDKEL